MTSHSMPLWEAAELRTLPSRVSDTHHFGANSKTTIRFSLSVSQYGKGRRHRRKIFAALKAHTRTHFLNQFRVLKQTIIYVYVHSGKLVCINQGSTHIHTVGPLAACFHDEEMWSHWMNERMTFIAYDHGPSQETKLFHRKKRKKRKNKGRHHSVLITIQIRCMPVTDSKRHVAFAHRVALQLSWQHSLAVTSTNLLCI